MKVGKCMFLKFAATTNNTAQKSTFHLLHKSTLNCLTVQYTPWKSTQCSNQWIILQARVPEWGCQGGNCTLSPDCWPNSFISFSFSFKFCCSNLLTLCSGISKINIIHQLLCIQYGTLNITSRILCIVYYLIHILHPTIGTNDKLFHFRKICCWSFAKSSLLKK